MASLPHANDLSGCTWYHLWRCWATDDVEWLMATTARRGAKDRFVLLALKAAKQGWSSLATPMASGKTRLKSPRSSALALAVCKTIESELQDPARSRRAPRQPFLVPKMIVDSAAGIFRSLTALKARTTASLRPAPRRRTVSVTHFS